MKRRAVAAGVLCVLSVLAVSVVLLSTNEVEESALAERRVNVQNALGHVAFSHGVFSSESQEDRDASEFFPKEYKHGASSGVDDVIASVEADLAGVSHSKHVAPAERINTGERIHSHSMEMAHADDHPNPFLSAKHDLGGLIATKHPHYVSRRKVQKTHRSSAIKWKALQHKLHKELSQKSNALIASPHEKKTRHKPHLKVKTLSTRGLGHTHRLVNKAIKNMDHKLKVATHIRSKKNSRKLHKLVKRAESSMEQRLKVAKRQNQKVSAKEKKVKAHRNDDITKARVKGDKALAKAEKKITKQQVKAEDKYFERKLQSQFNKIVRESFAKKDLPSVTPPSVTNSVKNTAGPFKKAAQRRVAKKTKHLRSKVLRLSAKLAKLRQESSVRKAKLRLKASKMRAQQRLARLKDARDDELEIAQFPRRVRTKLRLLRKSLLYSKTKAYQRKKLAQLQREEKRALKKVLRNQHSVSRMTAKLATAKAHLAKLSKRKVTRDNRPSVMMSTPLEEIEGHAVSRQEEIGGLEDEVLNMEKQMRLQTVTILKQEQLLAARRDGMQIDSAQERVVSERAAGEKYAN